MDVIYAPKFVRQYKKLPREIKILAEKRQKIFCTNPFDARLKTHKLSGELAGFYAFSVNFSFRIIFDFKNDMTARFYEIGTHDIYE